MFNKRNIKFFETTENGERNIIDFNVKINTIPNVGDTIYVDETEGPFYEVVTKSHKLNEKQITWVGLKQIKK